MDTYYKKNMDTYYNCLCVIKFWDTISGLSKDR